MSNLPRRTLLRPRSVAALLLGLLTATLVVVDGPFAADPLAVSDSPGLRPVSSYLSVSPDGRDFSPSIGVEVFDDGLVWVPGDRHRDAFWVRNDGPSPGNVTARLLLGPDDSLMRARAFSLRLQGRALQRSFSGDLTRRLVAGGRASRPVVLVNHLRPGRRARIVLAGALAGRAPNRLQDRRGQIALLLVMEMDPDSRVGRGEKSRRPGGERG